jgi:uncharacterized SAM-binding protein YcdF (DUF218 family)
VRDLARGAALFLAMFSAVSAVIAFRASSDPTLWWLDLRAFPRPFAMVFVAMLAIALVAAFIGPRTRAWRVAASTTLLAGALAALVNAATFYSLLARGRISSRMPIPFSLAVAAALVMIAWTLRRTEKVHRPVVLSGFVLAAVAFPLFQLACLGSTDYRRPADVIVVFGARAYANGTASSALADRVRTACELYNAGYAPKLLFSGGPGDGAIDEPHAMARLAEQLGVPRSAMILDPAGVNTDATARNTRALVHERDRVIAVSHFYHLPRIKLAYQRVGIDVWTVPSATTAPSQLLYNVPRECVAFWVYYSRWLFANA